ncbi:hypothetical protein SRHO_G00131740 [Serrasalmus rhombeus]
MQTFNEEFVIKEGQSGIHVVQEDFDDLSPNTISVPEVSNKNILDMCASAVVQVQVAGVGQGIVNDLVCSLEEIVHEIQNHFRETVLKQLPSENTQCVNQVKQSLSEIENPFTQLNSKAKRSRYFSHKWSTVNPVEEVLGVRFDKRRNKSTGTYDQIVVSDKLDCIVSKIGIYLSWKRYSLFLNIHTLLIS